MSAIKSIAVFCASSMGHDPKYGQLASDVGMHLANVGIRVVYGGSRNGMMGCLADGALKAGGEVIGVIPRRLGTKELAHTSLTCLEYVEDMHQRKQRMHELSDAVLALPGGFGTLDELVEMITWRQMNIHQKPIVLLNAFQYYEHLLAFIAHAVDQGLIRQRDLPTYTAKTDIASMLQTFGIE